MFVNLSKIITDWAYKLNDGIPAFNDASKILLLQDTLRSAGWGEQAIKEFTKQIIERKVGDDEIIKYKDFDGNPAEMKAGSAKQQPNEHPAKQAYDKLVGEDEPEDKSDSEEPTEPKSDELPPDDDSNTDDDIESDTESETQKQKQIAKVLNTPEPGSDNADAVKAGELDDTPIDSDVDRSVFDKKSKKQKDAPNGPTQQQMLEDLNEGNIDKITEYQNEVEQNRALGIAGAGGAIASEGESKYCNACNMDRDDFKSKNEAELLSLKEGLRNQKRTADEKRTATTLGYNPDDEEFLDILAEAQLFCNQKTAEVKADKNSVLYKKGKKGFADAKVGTKKDPEGAYCEWMKAGYFGSITTKQRLDESKIDTSQPYKVVQSTTELDDSVQAHLEDMYTNAKTPEDKAYYKKQLKLFKKFRTYHDTFTIGKDKNGRTAIVSISNKKDSQARDPQNNTTPAQRLRFIKSTFGEDIAKNVSDVIDNGVEKVSNSAAETIRSQTKMVIDDDIVKVCEEDKMAPYMGVLDETATNGTHRFSKFLMAKGKEWDSLSTKEKLELMQEYSNSRLYDKNGTSRIIAKSYVNNDGETVDGTFYIDDDGNEVGPIKSLGAAQIGLPFEPFGKIAIKLGEFGANEETKRIKTTEKELVTEVHTEVTQELFEADSEEGGYHPTDRPDADNGKNTQGYILGTMKAIHIDTYIDMDDDDDDALLIQMGVNGVKPSMVRECVTEKSGFTGDTKTPEGKKALKEFILKRCRVTPGGEKISVMNGDNEVELFNDQWRTAGTNQKVASYFGSAMRECLQKKAAR